MPNASAEKYISRLQVKVVAGRMNVARHDVRETRRRMRLVRPLIRREPYVAIDPKHRAALRTRIGDELRADLLEPRCKVRDEGQHWLTHVAFVPRAILLKPFTPIVLFEFLEKLK